MIRPFDFDSTQPGDVLRRERLRRGWSQQELAARLGRPRGLGSVISRAEGGQQIPSATIRTQLLDVLGIDPWAPVMELRDRHRAYYAASRALIAAEEQYEAWRFSSRRGGGAREAELRQVMAKAATALQTARAELLILDPSIDDDPRGDQDLSVPGSVPLPL